MTYCAQARTLEWFERQLNSRKAEPVTDDRTTLAMLSEQLADAVATAGAALVAVHARPRLPSTGVHWKDGVVVTTDGTIRREDDIEVTLPDGRHIPATLAGRDRGTDLAVLRIGRGYVARGWIGAAMQPVRLDPATQQRLKREGGLLLLSVEPDAPASRAGLLVGDIVVAIDRKDVDGFDQLLDVLGGDVVGKKLKLEVVRAGQPVSVDVVIDERPRRAR